MKMCHDCRRPSAAEGEMSKFRMIDLFSGIGGFSLAASWVWGEDLEIACFCEKDEFCRRVLKKHWPQVETVEDVYDLERIVAYATRKRPGEAWEYLERSKKRFTGSDSEQYDIDLMCGGPPCQPASTAGLRKGSTDPRWLWPQTIKIVEAVNPRWIVFENPIGIVSLAEPICKPQVESKTVRRSKTEDRYEAILTQQEALLLSSIIKDLKDLGYQFPEACDGTPILPVIPASAVGAPHRRDRVWIVAKSNAVRCGWRQDHQGKQEAYRNGDQGATTLYSKGITVGAGLCQNEPGRKRRKRLGDTDCHAADTNHPRLQKREVQLRNSGTQCATLERNPWDEHWYEVATRLCRVDDELPRRMDRNRVNRLRALGNAVVPGVVMEIMKAIKFVDKSID